MIQPDPWWFDVGKALVGTFVGAVLAFASNYYFQYRQRRRENLAAGHVATLVVAQQASDYISVRAAFLAERQQRVKDPAASPAWLYFKPMRYAFSDSLRFDFRALAFLAETKHFTVLQKLMLAETHYRSLSRLVAKFNDEATQLQKSLLALGVRDGVPFILEEVERRLPVDLRATNVSLAQALVLRFEKDESDYRDALDSLHAALVAEFGPTGILKAEPRPPASEPG